jgi:uncharacterized protein YbaR (Trm112 family)
VFDKSFLDILACPLCKTEIRLEEAASRFVCVRCGRRYPIRDGFPVLLVEEAELPPAPAPPTPEGER